MITLHKLAFLNDNFIVAALFILSRRILPLKTHLMKTRRMEHKNALDFYTSQPPSFFLSRPNIKVFVLSLLCYRLKGQMVFYSHRKCVVGLKMDLALTPDDGEVQQVGGLMLSKFKKQQHIKLLYNPTLGLGRRDKKLIISKSRLQTLSRIMLLKNKTMTTQ